MQTHTKGDGKVLFWAETAVMWTADQDCHQPSNVKASRKRFSPHLSKVSMALLMLRFRESFKMLDFCAPEMEKMPSVKPPSMWCCVPAATGN